MYTPDKSHPVYQICTSLRRSPAIAAHSQVSIIVLIFFEQIKFY